MLRKRNPLSVVIMSAVIGTIFAATSAIAAIGDIGLKQAGGDQGVTDSSDIVTSLSNTAIVVEDQIAAIVDWQDFDANVENQMTPYIVTGNANAEDLVNTVTTALETAKSLANTVAILVIITGGPDDVTVGTTDVTAARVEGPANVEPVGDYPTNGYMLPVLDSKALTTATIDHQNMVKTMIANVQTPSDGNAGIANTQTSILSIQPVNTINMTDNFKIVDNGTRENAAPGTPIPRNAIS